MSDKYIIKNCPCYDYGFCTSKTIYVAGCSQCTDCKLKQIVELANIIKSIVIVVEIVPASADF